MSRKYNSLLDIQDFLEQNEDDVIKYQIRKDKTMTKLTKEILELIVERHRLNLLYVSYMNSENYDSSFKIGNELLERDDELLGKIGFKHKEYCEAIDEYLQKEDLENNVKKALVWELENYGY